MDQYQHFFIPLEKGTFISLKAEELIMVEAGDSYATIFTINGNFLSLMSLNAMEQKLGDDFCRIHRSFIVSIHHVKKILSDTLIPPRPACYSSNVGRPLPAKHLCLQTTLPRRTGYSSRRIRTPAVPRMGRRAVTP
ncbi:LytR/AlgR family response regulator transcription factor [Filimonas effusa]|uniref:LytTR family transcriptional regulator n=1 Tax=Filimonas effusa TaxID=2508721 RepID=A0A4Q1DAR5_9BACT|nr:LytTR family DNA-binding domain-containing protein [Filimonas effusa]RXK85998.1 LytTR family transcriptional regulator [Filimonas effusa]